ncbi:MULTISPECIES: LexA family protein [Aeromonas]|uniref:LexA family protein n=1 Tax=Aeromonas caviae TaxID=648 RepID=UPI0038D2375F
MEKETWHSLAKSRMKKLGITQEQLAEKLGVTQGAIGHWLNKRREPSMDIILGIMAALELKNISIGIDGSITNETQNIEFASPDAHRIPVLNYVQAGVWTSPDEIREGDGNLSYITTDLELGDRAFAIVIRGSSMEPEFVEGDVVLIDPDEPLHPGDFVVAKNGEEEATFKKYRPRGIGEDGQEVFELVPLNDDYPTMRSDRQPIQIIGTMVEHRRRRKRR